MARGDGPVGGPACGVLMNIEQSLRPLSESSARSGSGSERRNPLTGSHWLLAAVALCWLSWPAPAEAQPSCVHDICDIGGNLNPVCDPCVDDICFGDAYCCTVEWDDDCIDQVETVCGDLTCAAFCKHSPCDVGIALDATCDSCAAQVCFQNPSCCTDDGDPLTDDWDASCVTAVQTVCGYQCNPGENVCSNALPMTPGKIYGTLFGASNDGKENINESNRSADVWYEYTQGAANDMVLYTCQSQRAFGIDTVLSVHSVCGGGPGNTILANDDWMLGNLPQACVGTASPNNVDSSLPLGSFWALDPGETVKIRIAHHDDSVRGNFQFVLLPEPNALLALVSGIGALSVLSRRRARS